MKAFWTKIYSERKDCKRFGGVMEGIGERLKTEIYDRQEGTLLTAQAVIKRDVCCDHD
jgi:hypothetical protein